MLKEAFPSPALWGSGIDTNFSDVKACCPHPNAAKDVNISCVSGAFAPFWRRDLGTRIQAKVMMFSRDTINTQRTLENAKELVNVDSQCQVLTHYDYKSRDVVLLSRNPIVHYQFWVSLKPYRDSALALQ